LSPFSLFIPRIRPCGCWLKRMLNCSASSFRWPFLSFEVISSSPSPCLAPFLGSFSFLPIPYPIVFEDINGFLGWLFAVPAPFSRRFFEGVCFHEFFVAVSSFDLVERGVLIFVLSSPRVFVPQFRVPFHSRDGWGMADRSFFFRRSLCFLF